MDNLYIYNQVRDVPKEALKPIQAGRLKGMSDINPMWRLKKLTETFGPCGIGWWYTVTREEIVYDEITKQKCAFVDIELFFKDPQTGEVSHALPGTGGASFVANEKNGPYMSDECYKMALTDAISVAAKPLGLGASVYYANDRSKYTEDTQPQQTEQQRPAPQAPPAPPAQQPDQWQVAHPGSSWNSKEAIKNWCAQMGIDARQFAACRKALIDGGVVPNIIYDDLTPVDFDNLCRAMTANYNDMLGGQA